MSLSDWRPALPKSSPRRSAAITTGLIATLVLLNAVPPFSTDMYAPSFPQMATGLGTTAAMIGLTLTAFLVGMGLGQVTGGAVSDQVGRRRPILSGAVVCTLGAVGCALAPSIGLLIAARLVQGLGGGAAIAAARALLVDLTVGDQLAKIMTLMMAIGGLAPMIAPVAGGVIASVASWRVVFWGLVAFGLIMTTAAFIRLPESLPPERRQAGGLRRFGTDLVIVLRLKPFLGYLMLNCFSGAALFAYISDSSYVLQGLGGLSPLGFSLVFAGNALVNMSMSFLNSWLVGRVRPRQMIRNGLMLTASGIALLTVSVFALGTALLPTCLGFLLLLAGQAFIFGNAAAMALSFARQTAGTASALLGLIGSLVNSIAAPLASSGGETSAHPMVMVMLVGSAGSWLAYYWTHRLGRGPAEPSGQLE